MTRLRRVEVFSTELTKFLDKSIRELDLTWAELLGVLHMKVAELTIRSLKKKD